MILDTSALAAILFGEPEAARYTRIIHDADRCLISVANFVELCMVVEGQIGSDAGRQCDTFFRRAGIIIETSHSRARTSRSSGVPRFRQGSTSGRPELRRLFRLRSSKGHR